MEAIVFYYVNQTQSQEAELISPKQNNQEAKTEKEANYLLHLLHLLPGFTTFKMAI